MWQTIVGCQEDEQLPWRWRHDHGRRPIQAFFWNPLHPVQYLRRMTSVWLPVKSKILYVHKGNAQPYKLKSPNYSFNPDITKQAVEVIFSCKKNKLYHPDLDFNGIPVAREDHTKHLGAHLDSRLNFSKHISEAVRKASKGLGLLKYLSKYVSRKVLDLSYKLYVRHLLD